MTSCTRYREAGGLSDAETLKAVHAITSISSAIARNSVADAVLRGASERVPATLTTVTVTGLGLLLPALGSGAPRREIEGPIGNRYAWRAVTSTALNLLVLPTLALLYAGNSSGPARRFEQPAAPAEGRR
jgi:Cu/Ag efflux pump CusA